MKRTDSQLQRDMQYGQVVMLTTTPDQDMKANQDYVLGTLTIAMRRRKVRIDKYGEISIRAGRATGAKTEMAKIIDGDCLAPLFVFEFLDCFIICTLPDIKLALKQRVGYEKLNHDKVTSAWYIPIGKIRHLRVEKSHDLLERCL